MSSADALWPPAPLLHDIITHCRSAYPAEACGLWSRSSNGTWRCHPLANQSPEPQRSRRFALDPLELLPLLEAEDTGALTLHGLYHSHPDGPAILSATDRAGLTLDGRPTFAGWSLIVVGLPHDGPATLSLYQWDKIFQEYTCKHTMPETTIQ